MDRDVVQRAQPRVGGTVAAEVNEVQRAAGKGQRSCNQLRAHTHAHANAVASDSQAVFVMF